MKCLALVLSSLVLSCSIQTPEPAARSSAKQAVFIPNNTELSWTLDCVDYCNEEIAAPTKSGTWTVGENGILAAEKALPNPCDICVMHVDGGGCSYTDLSVIQNTGERYAEPIELQCRDGESQVIKTLPFESNTLHLCQTMEVSISDYTLPVGQSGTMVFSFKYPNVANGIYVGLVANSGVTFYSDYMSGLECIYTECKTWDAPLTVTYSCDSVGDHWAQYAVYDCDPNIGPFGCQEFRTDFTITCTDE